MKVKILLGSFIFLIFAPLASASQSSDHVLTSVVTESEAKMLNIQIPENESPGYKSLEVNISGMGKAPQLEKIYFCKDLDGIINWDNNCPDLLESDGVMPVESLPVAGKYLPYDPLSNPKRTTGTAIVAFAALAAVTGAGAVGAKVIEKTSSKQEGYLAGLSRGAAVVVGTQLGRGDKRKIWTRPVNGKMDRFITKTGTKISRSSPLAARILSDGNYQRSLIGPFSLLIYPLSIGVGYLASRSVQHQALPPSLAFILVMMGIGIADALAGIFIALSFTVAVLAGGNLAHLSPFLTVIGVSTLAFAPALLAGAFRPFRREIWNFTSLWERVTDYALASVLTGWVVEQIVLGLPGLSGLQLPLAKDARAIAFFAAGLVVARFALEDISTRLFPQRLIALEPEYRDQAIVQQIIGLIFKVTIFGLIAGKFVGISSELFIGIGIYSVPLIMGIFASRFPKSAGIQKWMPTGIIEMLVLTVVGYFLALSVQSRYPNARTYVLLSFVLLSLPGLILKVLELFGKDGAADWKVSRIGKIGYRSLGVVALATLIYIILSGLLVSNHV